MSGTWEEDYANLKKLVEGPHKKNDDPNLVEDLAYRMRFADNGVVWHSWVDPNRPESPPVEWPQYPKDERDVDMPEEGIMSHETDPRVLAAARQQGMYKENPYKPIIGTGGPCTINNNVQPIENPDEADDYLESIETPRYPGLYRRSGNLKWGGGGMAMPGYYNEDDTEDDYEY